MQGRIVFPEVRQGRPVWLIGRLLETASDEVPRYLGLAGNKPLLGWDRAGVDFHGACVVEGPTDWLALRMWGAPGLALCGTGASLSTLKALKRWERLYLVMDADDAGREATARLCEALGDHAVPVALPTGVKDLGELAPRPDGGVLLAQAITSALAATRNTR
jgi:DNA primase